MRIVVALFLAMLLVACGGSGREPAPIIASAPGAETQQILFATNRAPGKKGPFGPNRVETLQYGQAVVAIPPGRQIGTVRYGGKTPRPRHDFHFAALRTLKEGAFKAKLNSALHDTGGPAKDITLFVHGFNNSYADAMFRMAQMKHDLELPGVPVVYAWPSRARPLAYEYDSDSALFSRDGLVHLLRTLAGRGDRRIVLIAHSMGSHLLMEALRQIEIADPGWTDRSVTTVVLVSPDIGVDVFRSQIRQMRKVPDPFVIFTSHKDSVLDLSARLSGVPQRLGNLRDVSRVADLPITLADVSNFDVGSRSSHFTTVTSPTLIALLKSGILLDSDFMRGHVGLGKSRLAGDQASLGNASQIILANEGR